MDAPSLRATQMPLASTWKHRLPSSSHRVAVTRGFIPGGAICPVVSKPVEKDGGPMPAWLTPGSGKAGCCGPMGLETEGGPAGDGMPLA